MKSKDGIYVNKAVMEMKPDEAGANANIGHKSIHKNVTYNVRNIRAALTVKVWSELSLSI